MQAIKPFYLKLFFTLCLLLLFISFFPILKRGIYLLDYVLYYYPVGQILSKDLNPYQATHPLLYSPPMLLLLRLLQAFPLTLGQYIFTLLSLLSLLSSLWLIIKISKLKPSFKWFLALSPFLFLSFPAKFTLAQGQINHFVLLLFTLSFYYYLKQKTNLSAIFLSASLITKFTPILSLLFFLTKKGIRVIKKIALYVFLAFTITMLFLPFKIIKDFFTLVLPSFLNHSENSSYYNQALSGLISRQFGNQPLLLTLITLALFIPVIKLLKSKASNQIKFANLITLNVLISPVSWQHHLVFLFFPLISLFALFYKNKKSKHLLVLLIVFLLISINIKNPQVFSAHFLSSLALSHATFGTLLLYLLFIFL